MLLDVLRERQKTLGLSPTEFAAKLGISYALWRKLIDNDREAETSLALIKGVVRAFPDLHPLVLEMLAAEDGKPYATATANGRAKESDEPLGVV